MKEQVAEQTAKAMPPAAVSAGGWFAGWDGSTLVTVATVAYIALQAAFLLWQWRQKKKQADAGQPI